MVSFVPQKVFYEKSTERFPLGIELLEKYKNMGIEIIKIDDHNKIPELRELPDAEFTSLKKYLVIGIRKSLRLLPNNRSADFIVPFTSSGCAAMCLYCYLVCTFFKGSYLRVFVNRDEIMNEVRKKAAKLGTPMVYEIGSNSDMVLENSVTGNLAWAIEQFSIMENAKCTFATKFADVDSLLDIRHNGCTQMRISVNPKDIIRKVEIGTSQLKDRINAANKMFNAGYKVGINIAPVILSGNWKEQYSGLFDELKAGLEAELAKDTFFEIIFMTYGIANDIINKAAMPGTLDIFEKDKMRPKGRGKYCYKPEIEEEASVFLRKLIADKFPKATISYIV